MKFNLITTNHEKDTRLQDFILLLELLFELAGHETEINGSTRTHILFDNFHHSWAARPELKDSIIVATEFLTGETFNDFGQPIDSLAEGGWSYPKYFQERYDGFKKCVQHAKAIWLASDAPEQSAAYSKFGKPVFVVPFPHCPNFNAHRPKANRDNDLYFWGSLTPHRKQTMLRLAKKHKLIYVDYAPAGMRARIMEDTKVCLGLKQAPWWPHASRMRYWLHLCSGSFLLGERCDSQCDLDRFVVTTDSIDDACAELLGSGLWRKAGTDAYQRFAAEQPGRPAAEELLEKTFGRT